MDKKEILNLFNEEMNPYFKKWGFKFYKTKLEASQAQGYVTKRIFFDANYFMGKGVFQPYLRVRNEIMMAIRGKVNKRYNNTHFLTISKHLPEVTSLYKRKDLNFLCKNLGEHDLGAYIYSETMPFYRDHFVEFMEEVGLKFFETFYTNEDFNHWFNQGIFEGKYDHVKINQDTIPIYSYIAAFITENECVEDIYNYWMNYDLYQEAKEEITLVSEYLKKDYEA